VIEGPILAPGIGENGRVPPIFVSDCVEHVRDPRIVLAIAAPGRRGDRSTAPRGVDHGRAPPPSQTSAALPRGEHEDCPRTTD
jgi:hypothetical protein